MALYLEAQREVWKMTTGQKIAEERKKLQLTQQQLADEFGVTRQAVSRWESDLAFPEMDVLIKMSERFGCTIDYLVKYNGSTEEEEPVIDSARDENANVAEGANFWQRLPYFEWKSKTTLFGLPLLHVNIGLGRVAKGVFAIGLVSVGFFSAGLVSVGLLAWGIIALGLFSCGSISLGALIALGGVAIGTFIAFGGLAVGCFSFGGCAVGLYAFGGYASGSYVAIGDWAVGGITFGKSHSTGTVIAVFKETFNQQKDEAFALMDELPPFWRLFTLICKGLAQGFATGV